MPFDLNTISLTFHKFCVAIFKCSHFSRIHLFIYKKATIGASLWYIQFRGSFLEAQSSWPYRSLGASHLFSFEAGGVAAALPDSLRIVGVKPVGIDPDFQPELSCAGSRLAVVKFTMRGCGPCLRIAPAFSSMSNKYPQAVFLEVDVHQCQGTAATNNISATPTFLFFRNKVRIDQYQGADAVGLEEKIKQHLENDPGSNEDTDIPKGYMDLMPFINKAGCECLNESDEHGFDNCLRKDMTFLESDCDEQLLITVAFNQPVKLYSMKFQGPDNGQGPKYVKIFINLPRSMDFEEAERSEPTQALELTEDDIKEDGIVPLRYVKFQNVNSVTIFVQSNQGEEETTRISYFTFIGTPVQATNMNDFKRVVGKKGESH
ncbi:thioredoxin-like protein 1 [Erinaceus europaeus]|uniref:Thioredoxin-like protein 1 n=1 Tax=Erinaceus europaeus TaxID=9365 RepID=A0ABM3WS45_ERIEU|nr:thioredoxin-like protein 1 [Erinaceus europaeus]